MPTYEVFLKKDGKDEYRHAGALDAANDELAMVLARECYVRRAEGDRIWLVDRANVIEADPDFLESNADKPHRHHSGEAVAARRKAARAAAGGAGAPQAEPEAAGRESGSAGS
ncbi:MAG: hypothetical protein ACR2QK_04300 [Acidimicrobiales bacterium]